MLLSRSKELLALCLLAAAPAWVGAQSLPDTRPQATPETRPAVDLSTPRAAVRSFLAAFQKQDITAMRATLQVTAADEDDVDALMAMLAASGRLIHAFNMAYGPAATVRQLGPTPASRMENRLKTLETIEPRIEGDSATLELPPDDASHRPGGTIKLQKIGNDWKLDPVSALGLPPDIHRRETTVRVARAITPIADKLAADIADDKDRKRFPSAEDAAQEFWTRSTAAIAAATRPGTATGPAAASAPETVR